jgi:hypothetical protein
MTISSTPGLRPLFGLLLSALLSGCSSWAPDGGLTELQASLATKLPPAQVGAAPTVPRPGQPSQAAIALLLEAPLSLDAATRIALLNNPGLQRQLAASGLNITDQVAAAQPDKARAATELARLRAQVQQAWVRAVAAGQRVAYLTQAKETAEASGELARRMVRAGNWSRLQQSREQQLLAELARDLEHAQLQAFEAREALTVVLGLWGEQTRFSLPAELPALPTKASDYPDVEARALQAHGELALAVSRWELQRNKWVEPGPAGLWSTLRDDASVRELAVKLRSQARTAYQRYRSLHALARHEQAELQPLRQFIHEETLLRYNGMLSSVFELLAESRAQTRGAIQVTEALRDFWLADAELQAVLAGGALAP